VSPQTNKVLLNTVLLHVDQTDPNSVLILTENTQTGERHEFRARKLISSIPINQYPQIVFEPELPYYKRAFHKFCQAGNYIKFLVTYKTTFWRPKGMSGEGTYDGSVKWVNEERFERFNDDAGSKNRLRRMPTLGAVAEVFDGTNEDKQPALVGFIAGKAAVEWAEQSDELRRNEVIEDLARVYGPEARDYVDYCEKNWAYEPYNGGTVYMKAFGGLCKHFIGPS
jgi:monoamine oxidase